MNNTKTTTIEFSEAQKALHKLIIETARHKNIGLFDGLMGASIIFYMYDKYLGKKLFSNLAGGLLDKVWESINKMTPTSFDVGLCGIGWGAEFLIQNNFVEGNGADICEDINLQIMKEDPRRIVDLSLEKGVCGLLHYLLIHIKGCIINGSLLSFDNIYLQDVHERINSISKNKINDELHILIDQFNQFYMEREVCEYKIDVLRFVEQIPLTEGDVVEDNKKEDISATIGIQSTNDTTKSTVMTPNLSIGLRSNVAYDLIKTFIN